MIQRDLKANLKCELSNIKAKGNEPSILVTAVRLPTGAIEVISNNQYLVEKIEYIDKAYDDEFRLVANPKIQIIGFMLV